MTATLEGNKLVAAILTAGIVASGSGVLSRILYSPHKLEQPVYRVELPGEVAEEGPAEAAKPLPVLLAEADPAAGQSVARRCAACHTFDKDGPNRVGPNLWGIVGRPIGGHAGFSYSSAMAGHGGEWTYEDLDHFIADPKGYAPGTKMAFAGIRRDTERANLLAYLRTLSDDPAPLPES
jgi:cytochrome c